MISASDRENAVLLINEAIASGASCKKACWTVWIVNFNTSHVTVYRKDCAPQTIQCTDFNTSHVTVYHNRDAPADVIEYNFNTSHVTVYQKPYGCGTEKSIISIHLMLRFIAKHP